MGDFNRQRPSPQQLDSVVRLTAWLMQEHGVQLDGVRTHRDVAQGQTSCPGRDFYRYFEDGQFKRWVQVVIDGRPLEIDPGLPLAGDPPGPTELITETRKSQE